MWIAQGVKFDDAALDRSIGVSYLVWSSANKKKKKNDKKEKRKRNYPTHLFASS